MPTAEGTKRNHNLLYKKRLKHQKPDVHGIDGY